MTKEMVLKEFRDFTLNEVEIDKIAVFYRSGADLLGTFIGPRVLDEGTPLKLTLNSIKHAVTLMLELRNDPKERS